MIDQMKIAAHVILILALLSILMLAISFWLDIDVQEAQAIQPVVTKDNEFAKGARMAAKAIFAEFGIGYKNGDE